MLFLIESVTQIISTESASVLKDVVIFWMRISPLRYLTVQVLGIEGRKCDAFCYNYVCQWMKTFSLIPHGKHARQDASQLRRHSVEVSSFSEQFEDYDHLPQREREKIKQTSSENR